MAHDPKRVQSIFLAAVEAGTDDRAALLDRECGEDRELRKRVEALLRAHDAPDSMLDKPAVEIAATLDSGAVPPAASADSSEAPAGDEAQTAVHPADWSPGTAIADRYVLQQPLGEGGMGEVWVAKQSEPVKRRVAIKLIKAGMDSRAVLTRFEHERQALAMMDHPNIARVFDGGLTADRRPYFVMELVNGLPLTKFCDETQMTPKERLELFVPICQAVHHAHQKGIVHRDLKPANILVTMIDGRPVPKVIDFGVAKAIGGKLTDESMATQFGSIIGTLEYMSPEQAGFSGQDVDTRADIYSLGVILYELLTGLRPIDSARLKDAALAEMIRIVCEEEPSKPSTRLSTDDALPTLAAVRRIEPRRLTTLLRGELDWVVMKCLDKQRDRRYESASALVRDIENYLSNQPVEARPPSLQYRASKFLRRNRGPVAAAAVVLCALIAGVIGTSVGLVRAERARKAEASQRGIAEDNERRAREESQKAFAAAQAEREAKDAAVKARQAETRQRLVAIEKTRAALAAKREAEAAAEAEKAAKDLAEQRRLEATEQRVRAEQSLYSARIALAENHLSTADSVNAQRSLTAAVPAEGEVDRRGWEWYYLLQRADSASRIFREPVEDFLRGASMMIVSDDGQFVAAPEYAFIHALALGPQGRVLAAASGGARDPYDDRGLPGPNVPGEVVLRDFATGRELRSLTGYGDIVTAVKFHPDGGSLAAAVHNGTVVLSDIETGLPQRTFQGPSSKPATRQLSFSSDGSRLLAVWREPAAAFLRAAEAQPGTAIVYSVADGQTVHQFPTASAIFRHEDDSIYFVDPEETRAIHKLDLANLESTLVAQAPDGKTGLRQLCLSATGTYLAALRADQVIVWDLSTKTLVHELRLEEPALGASFSPDDQSLCTYGDSGAVRVWDVASGRGRDTHLGHVRRTVGALFSPDNQWLITCGLDGAVRVFRNEDDGRGTRIVSTESQIAALRFRKDGKQLRTLGTQNRSIETWDTATLATVSTLSVPVHADDKLPKVNLVFSPDGQRIAAPREDDPHTVTIWDADTGEELVSLARSRRAVSVIQFSEDGTRIATAANDFPTTELCVWDARTGQLVGEPRGVPSSAYSLAFSPDGQSLAVGTTGAANIWHFTTGAADVELYASQIVVGVAFSPDGRKLAGADQLGSQVWVWDAVEGEPLSTIKDIRAACDVAFSPDGTRLAAIGREGHVHLFDAETRDELLVLRTVAPPAGSLQFTPRLAFSADGSRIAANSAHGIISLWDAGSQFTRRHLANHLAAAQAHFTAGRYEQAIEAARRAVQSKLDSIDDRRAHARAWTILEQSFEKQAQSEEADRCRGRVRELLEQILAEEPADADAATQLALNLLRSQPSAWQPLAPTDLNSYAGAGLTRLENHAVLVDGQNRSADVYTLAFEGELPRIQTLRLEAVQHDALSERGPGRNARGHFKVAGVRVFTSRTADGQLADEVPLEGRWSGLPSWNPDEKRWKYELDQEWVGWGTEDAALLRLANPIEAGSDQQLFVQIQHAAATDEPCNLGCFRLSVSDDERSMIAEQLRRTIESTRAGGLRGLTALAAVHAFRGEWEEAARCIHNCPQNDRSISRLLDFDELFAALPAEFHPTRVELLRRVAGWLVGIDATNRARQVYKQLAELQPDEPQWKNRLELLQQDLSTCFFDRDSHAFFDARNCVLDVSNDTLTVTSIGPEPSFVTRLGGPAGGKSLTFFYRCPQPVTLQLRWTQGLFSRTRSMKYPPLPPTEEGWGKVTIPIVHDNPIAEVIFAIDLAPNHSLEMSELVLHNVERDAALDRMATLAELGAINARLFLATYYIHHKMWREAAEVHRMLVDSQAERSIYWLLASPVIALSGDRQLYDDYCAAMREQFQDTSQLSEVEHTIKASLLLPGTSVEGLPLDRLKSFAETASPESAATAWASSVLGLAALRSDDAEEARDSANRVLQMDLAKLIQYPERLETQCLLLLSMAEHELGNRDAALAALRKAQSLLTPALSQFQDQSMPSPWHDWLIADLLRREAEQRIEGAVGTVGTAATP